MLCQFYTLFIEASEIASESNGSQSAKKNILEPGNQDTILKTLNVHSFYYRFISTLCTRGKSLPPQAEHCQAVRTGWRTGPEHHRAGKDSYRAAPSGTVYTMATWR